MSGVEVVGLVLGAIPLLISGMEHYSEGVGTIKKIRNASDIFADMKIQLEGECLAFQNNLELLLEDNVEDDVLLEMLKDFNSPHWSDATLDQWLRRRLGRSFDVYFALIKAMDSKIQELMDSLKLSKDGKGPFDQMDKKSVLSALKNKLKFGLQLKKYQELVDEISSKNRRIEQLTAQSRSLAPIRESRQKRPEFETGRQHAISLYRTIQNKLIGSCKLMHKASLHMRSYEPSTPDFQKPKSERMRIVFQHLQPSTAGLQIPASWTTEEAEIEPLDNHLPEAPNTHQNSSLSISTGVGTSNVRFALQVMSIQATNCQLCPPKQRQQQQPHLQSLVEIHDLCASLQSHPSTQPYPTEPPSCFGYLSDNTLTTVTTQHRHLLYRPSNPTVLCGESPSTKAATTTSIALSQILKSPSAHKLGSSDKKLLALALASGMLRLHHTPWLEEQWGKHEVVLFQRRGGLVASDPFISAELSSPAGGDPLPQHQSSRIPNPKAKAGARWYFRPCRMIREQTVFALGILLIELALEKDFDELIGTEFLDRDGRKHEFTDYLAADRLVEEVYPIAGERYGDAVRRCVRCEFDHKNNSLLDAEFRRKVYDGVVAGLQADVRDMVCL